MENGRIFNIQRFSIHDGPGIRTVVFLKGCLLRCIWCHNPESVSFKKEISFSNNKCIKCSSCIESCSLNCIIFHQQIKIDREICSVCGNCAKVCPAKAIEIIGDDVTAKDVFEEVIKDIQFYETSDGGITLSGGEPTMQPKFCLKLLKLCKEAKIHTAIETSGECKRENIDAFINFTDLFLYDFKHLNSEKHKKFTGVGNERIIENLRYLINKKNIIVRIPVIPEFNNISDEMEEMAEFLRKIRLSEVHLLPFNKLGESKAKKLGKEYPYKKFPLINKKEINSFKEIFESEGLRVSLYGE